MLQTTSTERRAAGGDRRRGPPALRWECQEAPGEGRLTPVFGPSPGEASKTSTDERPGLQRAEVVWKFARWGFDNSLGGRNV
jgi:hypothetical protein